MCATPDRDDAIRRLGVHRLGIDRPALGDRLGPALDDLIRTAHFFSALSVDGLIIRVTGIGVLRRLILRPRGLRRRRSGLIPTLFEAGRGWPARPEAETGERHPDANQQQIPCPRVQFPSTHDFLLINL
jgi:hypothetical protein